MVKNINYQKFIDLYKINKIKKYKDLFFFIIKIKYFVFKAIYFILTNFLNLYIFFKYRPSFLKYDFHDSKLLLEFGGGETPSKRYEGFLNVDIRPLESVDVVCDIDLILDRVKPKSVSAIFSRHFLEHLTEIELKKHFENCRIMLCDEGVLEGIVPSTEFHIVQLISSEPGSKLYKHSFAGFNGWQRDQDLGYWDVHKSTFTYSSLRHLLTNSGFEVKFKKTNLKNIHFLAKIRK